MTLMRRTSRAESPLDGIGEIGMHMETTKEGSPVNKSYVNAAVSVAKHLGVRGNYDIFNYRRWIVWRDEMVRLDDDLLGTIQAAVAADLGTDGGIGNVLYVSDTCPG